MLQWPLLAQNPSATHYQRMLVGYLSEDTNVTFPEERGWCFSAEGG